MAFFMLRLEPRGRTTLSIVYACVQVLVIVRSVVSVFMLPSLAHVLLLTLRRPGCADISPVVKLAVCGACAARPAKTVLCTPYFSVTEEGELPAMMQNGPRLCNTSLFYAVVVMFSSMLASTFNR